MYVCVGVAGVEKEKPMQEICVSQQYIFKG